MPIDNSTLLYALGGLQTVNLLLLAWIKLDVRDIWKRLNNHGHSIDCPDAGCKPKTTAVVIHEV